MEYCFGINANYTLSLDRGCQFAVLNRFERQTMYADVSIWLCGWYMGLFTFLWTSLALKSFSFFLCINQFSFNLWYWTSVCFFLPFYNMYNIVHLENIRNNSVNLFNKLKLSLKSILNRCQDLSLIVYWWYEIEILITDEIQTVLNVMFWYWFENV